MRVNIHWDEEERAFVAIHKLEDGRVCRYAFLKSQQSKRLSGFASILRDLTLSENAASESMKIRDFGQIQSPFDFKIIKQSLLFSMIVSYAKCYTSAYGRGIKLDARDALKYADERLQKFHFEVMDMRHNYIAHAGETAFERNPVTAILHPNLKKKEFISVELNGHTLVNDDSRLNDYLSLFQAVKKYVIERVIDIKGRVESEATNIGLEHLYANSKLPNLEKAYPSPASLIK